MKSLLLILILMVTVVPALRSRAKRVAVEPKASEETGMECEFADSAFASEEPETVSGKSPKYAGSAPSSERVRKTVEPAVQNEEVPRPAFDLRQAVISTAILTNKYNSIEN